MPLEPYRNKNFMVYLTVDGMMDRVREYCDRYGITMSKLGQMALIEYLERKETKNNLQGSRLDTPTSHAEATTTTATNDATPTNTQAGLMSTTSSSSRGQRSGGGVVDVHVR
jgi:hypothetical protein